MAYHRVNITIFIVLFITITLINPLNAECCRDIIHSDPNCVSKYDSCKSICADGTPVQGYYCGVGSCDGIGCKCDGGCRRNSKGFDEDEARRLYHFRNSKPLPFQFTIEENKK